MAYETLNQHPETPIVEKWTWNSDIIRSDDGTEQTIALSLLPRREFSGNYTFHSRSEIRRHVAAMFALSAAQFVWPNWPYLVNVKAAIAPGVSSIYCTTSRSDFREGAEAFIIEGELYERVTIDAIFADHITLVDPVVGSFTKRANIVPLVYVYSNDNSAFVRRAADGSANSSFTFNEYGFTDPFIREDDEATLELFNSLPVLNKRAIGTEFTEALSTGIEPTDYGGQQSIRSRWNNSQYQKALQYLVNRVLDPQDLLWWKTFLNYCLGATNVFYVPSFREDFEIYTNAAGGGTTVVIANTEYSEHYAGAESFSTIVISRADGTQHFATITGVSTALGRDTLTFTPALPAGDWSEDQMVSFLLKCRLADGMVSLEHSSTASVLSLSIRTVD